MPSRAVFCCVELSARFLRLSVRAGIIGPLFLPSLAVENAPVFSSDKGVCIGSLLG